MNTNQVKGKAKEVLGNIQEHAGKLVGSKTQEAKGLATEAEGKVQKKSGDVEETLNKAVRDSKDMDDL